MRKRHDRHGRRPGIILPDKAQEKPTRAKVLTVELDQSTENGNFLMPLVQPGDIVRYMPYQLLDINFNNLGDTRGKQFLLAYGDTLARPSPEGQRIPTLPALWMIARTLPKCSLRNGLLPSISVSCPRG